MGAKETRAASDQRRGSRRKVGLIAALLAMAALLGLGVVLAPRSPSSSETGGRATRLAAPPRGGQAGRLPGTRPGPTGGAAPLAGAAAGHPPVDPHDTPEVPPPLPTGRFPYPPGSQPITEAFNPAMQPPEDDPVDVQSGVTCDFGPRVAVVHPPDPLVIDLQVKNRLGANLPITDGVARFRTETASPQQGPWFSAPLVDDGSGRDLAAGDYKYTATLQPTDDQKAVLLHDGVHLYVEVSFQGPNGLGERKYVTTMEYSREPDATLNGKYTDGIDTGSLVIDAGVTAKVAGEYRLVGSLYAGDTAIAFAQKTVTLPAGDGNTIPLLFFGKILHDRGIDGPYVLRYAMLFEHVGPDEIPGDPVDPAYTTQAYGAASFSDSPYAAPAPTFEKVDQNSPSQQGKPPPLFSEADRQNNRGPVAPIRPDPPANPATPAPTGTK